MKQLYKLIFLSTFLLFNLTIINAQIAYVKSDAAGAGNGTSWADAYTNLQDALDAGNNQEIWIAQGTYTPINLVLDTFNTFIITRSVAIYGGFAGNESTKEERVDGANTTILSGDIMGNDVDNNFTTNKEDNVFHVITIDAPVPSTIVFDGLTISGGNTSASNVNDEYSWRGGGIFTYNTVEVFNCEFNNNFGRSGGGIYISPNKNGGHGSIVDDCVFEKNSTFSQSSGMFISDVNDVTIKNSTFQNNRTNRGALYPIYCENLLIDNCDFKDNITTDLGNFGGAMFIWNCKGTIKDCTFENNNTGNGAAIHIDGREEMNPSASDFTIDNCTFTQNSAVGFGGGAVRSFSASYTLKNCIFNNNTAPNGGAIFSSGPGQDIIGMNNTFMSNSADFGACQASYGDFSMYNFINNTYIGNVANTSGGALINGFGSDVTIDSSEFALNVAGFGGAIFNQNDTTNVKIYNSEFVQNSVSDGSGGAVNVSGPVMLTIDNCLFDSNIAGFGGAINGSQGTEVDIIEGFVNIHNSRIILNAASIQGAGISLVDLDMNMTNTVLGTNFNTGTGAGGAMSLNTTANRSSTFSITNSTLADNFALIGSGIGAFSEDETSECIINLQNNIFDNEGLNYEVEGGNPIVNSFGGNISLDATLESMLTGPGDVNSPGDDVLFADPASYDFNLLEGSPAINIGVTNGAPDTDILGNPRIGDPDAGAYEYQGPVGIEVIDNEGQFTITPNPTASISTIELNNSWSGIITISVIDMSGQIVYLDSSRKTDQNFRYNFDASRLNTGNYLIAITHKNQRVTSTFIRI